DRRCGVARRPPAHAGRQSVPSAAARAREASGHRELTVAGTPVATGPGSMSVVPCQHAADPYLTHRDGQCAARHSRTTQISPILRAWRANASAGFAPADQLFGHAPLLMPVVRSGGDVLVE